MNIAEKPYIGSAVYILNFRNPALKVRFEQAQAEAAFAGFVNGQSQQTNVPDSADPNQARLIFQSEKKSIAISQAACQLQLGFHGSGLSFSAQLAALRKNVLEFCRRCYVFRDFSEYALNGLVVEVNFPRQMMDIKSELQILHERFIKTEKLGEVGSFQINLGYKVEDLFLNFSVSPYETRKFEVSFKMTSPIPDVNLNSLPVIENGLTVKIDVNNMPIAEKKGSEEMPSQLLSAFDDFVDKKFSSIIGMELPKGE
ncbi:hypothetical protein RugamoR57_29010 [Duganella caerulea]|uniref:hypothetical protein n=1 Tax=Duganella caerulea TaxID=2885762 RepID=UPI0030EA0AA3